MPLLLLIRFDEETQEFAPAFFVESVSLISNNTGLVRLLTVSHSETVDQRKPSTAEKYLNNSDVEVKQSCRVHDLAINLQHSPG